MADSVPELQDSQIAAIKAMKEDELVDFIRDTVERLNVLGDRLETYAREQSSPQQLLPYDEPGEEDGEDPT